MKKLVMLAVMLLISTQAFAMASQKYVELAKCRRAETIQCDAVINQGNIAYNQCWFSTNVIKKCDCIYPKESGVNLALCQ